MELRLKVVRRGEMAVSLESVTAEDRTHGLNVHIGGLRPEQVQELTPAAEVVVLREVEPVTEETK
jgi:hypothetical protein